MVTVRKLLMVGLGLLLAGCASRFESVPMKDSEQIESATVGLIPVNFIDKPSVEIIGNPVRFVPRVGGLIVAKGRDTKRRKFHNALLEADYVYQERVKESLTAAFERHGVDAVWLDISRTPHRQAGRVLEGRFEKRYPQGIDEDVDILLDAYVDFVGYAAEGLGDPYKPTFILAVRLVDAASHDVLYQNRFLYNAAKDPESSAVTIPADEAYVYAGFDELMADIPTAKAGLDQAIVEVADRVATVMQ